MHYKKAKNFNDFNDTRSPLQRENTKGIEKVVLEERDISYLRSKQLDEPNSVDGKCISVWLSKIEARAERKDLYPEEKDFIKAYKIRRRIEKLLKEYEIW
jgi:hypothetical protein